MSYHRPAPLQLPARLPSLDNESSNVEYNQVALDSLHSLLHLLQDDGWQSQGQHSKVLCYKNSRPLNSPHAAFLGLLDMDVPPLAVAELISNTQRKSEYDEIFENGSILHAFDEITHVEWWRFWTPSSVLVARRDLCILAHAALTADHSIAITAQSIDFKHKLDPALSGDEKKGFLRARATVGGFVVRALPGDDQRSAIGLGSPSVHPLHPLEAWNRDVPLNASLDTLRSSRRCRVLYVAQVDLKGSMPRVLHTKLFQRQPLQLAEMKRILENEQAASTRPPDAPDDAVVAECCGAVNTQCADEKRSLVSIATEAQEKMLSALSMHSDVMFV